jgi:oligosaccharyltransferase complex subunit alpha (ribophorin I)
MLNVLGLGAALLSLLLLQPTSGVAATSVQQPHFENTAIVRTVELGGSLTYLSTTYAVKALKDDVSTYIVSLSEEEYAVTSWIQAKVKGQNKPLSLSLLGRDHVR